MSQKKNTSYRLVIFFLSLLVIILLFKGYKDNKNAREIQNSLKEESYITQNQLSEMLDKYDSLLNKFNLLKSNSKNITPKNTDTTIHIDLSSYTSINDQIATIRDTIKKLKFKLAHLEKLNKVVSNKTAVKSVDLNKINASSKLIVSNLQARGVKVIKDNATNAQKKEIEQIRVCFSFEGTQFVDYGEKELFVQIVNPKNEIISKEKLVYQHNDISLRYSKKVDFIYNKQITDVCTYVDLEKNKIFKGRYVVNLYSGTDKMATTIFNYN